MNITALRVIVAALTAAVLQAMLDPFADGEKWRVVVFAAAFGVVVYVCERFWYRRISS
jgi:hypothetical protein